MGIVEKSAVMPTETRRCFIITGTCSMAILNGVSVLFL